MNKNTVPYPLILILLWLVIVCIVNPIGNFPLNDDWQYAKPVSFLINKGYYFSPDTYAPIIFAQVFWGALFCLPFGFSFIALRISVLVLGLAGVLVFYFLVFRITKNNKIAFLFALLLMLNPLYFSLSNTFMSDVPFIAVSIIAIYFFFRFFETPKKVFIICATIASIIATLIRQFGIIIPLAYALAGLVNNKSGIKSRAYNWIPLIISVLFLKLTLWWLSHIGSELNPYDGHTLSYFLSEQGNIARKIINRCGFILMFSGFFLMPVLLALGLRPLKLLSRKQKIKSALTVMVFLPSLIKVWSLIPLGNIVDIAYIGPLTLNALMSFGTGNILLHILVAAISFSGAILLLINLSTLFMDKTGVVAEDGKSYSSMFSRFVLFILLGYSFLNFVSGSIFDRYILFFLPLFSVLIVSITGNIGLLKGRRLIISYLCIFFIGSFTVAGTHDYLAWNRSRWQALNYLTGELNISPHRIDGGYEFNGWYLGNNFKSKPGKMWWFVDDNEYIVSFTKFDGYKIIKQYPYQNYFPYEVRNLCILHRE